MTTPARVIHRFEAAGLGRAPFSVIGVEVRRGPITLADGSQVGAPGQPMGCCDFCGQGIAECWTIRSADGREFVVGCDCVTKSGDAGLRKQIEPHLREKRREAAARRRDAQHTRVLAAMQMLRESEPLREALRSQPHPRGFVDRNTGRALTMLDDVEWAFANCGLAGRVRTAKWLEARAQEIK